MCTNKIMMGYYLKVSKIETIKSYDYNFCNSCDKEIYGKKTICEVHGTKLNSKTDMINEMYGIDDYDYNAKFKKYCVVNNIVMNDAFNDLVLSVFDNELFEFIISNKDIPSIIVELSQKHGIMNIPEFSFDMAQEFYSPIQHFLQSQGHNVAINFGIIKYPDCLRMNLNDFS